LLRFQAALRARRQSGFEQYTWFLCRGLGAKKPPQWQQGICSIFTPLTRMLHEKNKKYFFSAAGTKQQAKSLVLRPIFNITSPIDTSVTIYLRSDDRFD
jgi:hypothetical protein